MNSKSNGGPWWLQAIYKIGVPSALAVYLIWVLASRIDNNLTIIRENIGLHANDTSYLVKQNTQMEQLLRRICANTAKTVEERNSCFD